MDEVKNEKEKERLNNNQLFDQLKQLTSEKEELSRANDAWNDHQDVLQVISHSSIYNSPISATHSRIRREGEGKWSQIDR